MTPVLTRDLIQKSCLEPFERPPPKLKKGEIDIHDFFFSFFVLSVTAFSPSYLFNAHLSSGSKNHKDPHIYIDATGIKEKKKKKKSWNTG